jgi:hypothetical protein
MQGSLSLTDSALHRVGAYTLEVDSLRPQCSEVRVTLRKEQLCYQETFAIWDFVDPKNRLKEGRSLA